MLLSQTIVSQCPQYPLLEVKFLDALPVIQADIELERRRDYLHYKFDV